MASIFCLDGAAECRAKYQRVIRGKERVPRMVERVVSHSRIAIAYLSTATTRKLGTFDDS